MAKAEGKPKNQMLGAAKAAKKDEFYTQYVDIQKEIEAYLEFDLDTFRDKIVYCNCDDPFESNFFKYFAANFNRLGLKKLVTTSYDGSPIAGAQLTFQEYDDGKDSSVLPVSDGSSRTSLRSWITAIQRTSTAYQPINKPKFGTRNC